VGAGRKLPSKMTVRYGDRHYATFTVTKTELK
jgi:hypothetical protein